MRRPKPRTSKFTTEAQKASAYYANGPYTAHNAITCAVVNGPDNYHQTTATIMGAHRLAELLNHAHKVAHEYPSDIAPNSSVKAPEIVAHAVAKAMGWRLEPAHERKQRLANIARESGGPTVADPDRPYCKPDQSCCDFVCGN